MIQMPIIVGILNITADSFSDGGRFLDSDAAIAHSNQLVSDGAHIIELGPTASNPDAARVTSGEEIRRLDPVISHLKTAKISIAVDTSQPETQRYAISRGVDFLNDIQGFPDQSIYPILADANCKLVVMHGMHRGEKALRVNAAPSDVWDSILLFFETRIADLIASGIARERIILDPGMGYFLSDKPAASLHVLARLNRLKDRFKLPLLVSVSRKSFLRAITGREVNQIGPASLAAELFAALAGVSYIRTHDAGALADGLTVLASIHHHKDDLPDSEQL